jgi:hypothetical protein
MKFSQKHWLRKYGCQALALAMAVCGGVVQAAPAVTPPKTDSTPTNAVLAEVVIPKSVFRDDIANGGRDPFYPRSARRMQSSVAAENTQPRPVAAKINNLLSLKGIVSGAEKRKLALINNRHFAIGETNEVAIEGGRLVVQCLEIKEGSVVVRVIGKPERYELRMRLE